ncbi:hypothetical protein ACHAWF_004159, partial [Thalassiosira exigua]
IEGGRDAGGREPSIWDDFSRLECGVDGETGKRTVLPCVLDGTDGDVANDHYHRHAEDVRAMRDVGLRNYRFSLSWSRLVSCRSGTAAANPEGVKFYDGLIDELVSNGIAPFVTMFHWDLPSYLYDAPEFRGGFANNATVPEWNFYADLCFSSFGDRVKRWITFNEPWVIAALDYGASAKAPARNDPIFAPCTRRNTLRRNGGLIGTTNTIDWAEPRTESVDDVRAHRRAMIWRAAHFADPPYFGDYPDELKRYVGFRLPEFTEEEKRDLLDYKPDLFGLNHYTSRIVSAPASFGREPCTVAAECFGVSGASIATGWDDDLEVRAGGERGDDVDTFKTADHGMCRQTAERGGETYFVQDGYHCWTSNYWNDRGVAESVDESWPTSGSEWLFSVPWGLRKLLVWIANRYDNPDVYVTENGWSDRTRNVQEGVLDFDRRDQLANYTSMALAAIREDGVALKGYRFTERFGLHWVDFDPDSPDYLKRSPKLSAEWLQSVVAASPGGSLVDYQSDEKPYQPFRRRRASFGGILFTIAFGGILFTVALRWAQRGVGRTERGIQMRKRGNNPVL